MFQSLTGRLQTRNSASKKKKKPRFNPSQVGYKLVRKNGTPRRERFQSLTGRLQTIQRPPSARKASVFQSLTGRLQTVLACLLVAVYLSFNPSQVGYKRDAGNSSTSSSASFNPSQVGYKLLQALRGAHSHRVSIPHR